VKVIFLDIDGVLCISRTNPKRGRPPYRFGGLHPPAVAQLQRIVRATGALVVISSAWRLGLYPQTVLYLESCGVPRIRDTGIAGDVAAFASPCTEGAEVVVVIDGRASMSCRCEGGLPLCAATRRKAEPSPGSGTP